METRNSWGIVYVGAVFAALVIGSAVGISYFQKKSRTDHVVAVTKNFSDWHQVSSSAPTSTEPGPAPSDAISQDLLEGYAPLLNNGTFTAAEQNAVVDQVIKKNVTSLNIVPYITETDLTIGTTSVSSYLSLLSAILNTSTSVRHYELDVFTRTVSNQNANGTPELALDAQIYRRIAAAILVTEVPPELASKHLEVVKSVGALAKAVENLSKWGGDPIDALTLADSFNKANAYVTNSLNSLLATAVKLQKKKV